MPAPLFGFPILPALSACCQPRAFARHRYCYHPGFSNISNGGPRYRHRPLLRHAPFMGLFDTVKRTIGLTTPDAAQSAENERYLETYRQRIKRVNAFEDELEGLSDEELRGRVWKLYENDRDGADEGTVAEVYALVKEAGWRVWGLCAYDVQVMGAMALADGKVVEMATGEGKTLVAAMAAVVEGGILRRMERKDPETKKEIEKGGVFVVTVNDYLAKRDMEFASKLGKFLGVTVGLVQAGDTPDAKKIAYSCDVTYVTNSELGFDYLRDNLALSFADVVVTRPFYLCIVDEADSILIDEARTPLIITNKVDAPSVKYASAAKLADALQLNVHYTVNQKEQMVLLTERGYRDAENALRVSNLFNPMDPWALKITNALKAKELFKKDKHYIVRENQVQIVDEYTGRVLEGRRWSDGLHQAIDAKESIPISSEAVTSASISYQSFFTLFPRLAGMTGTAVTEAKEFRDTYGLSTVVIPTALPVARRNYPDAIFLNQRGKLKALLDEVHRIHKTGRPILIGTTSVAASEELSRHFEDAKLPYQVLNARPELAARESEIVARAGQKSAITIATNMAGRGTDILLGANEDAVTRDLARRALLENLKGDVGRLDAARMQGSLGSLIPEDVQADLLSASAEVATTCPSPLISLDQIDSIINEVIGSDDQAEGTESHERYKRALWNLGEVLNTIKHDFVIPRVEKLREEVVSLGGLFVLGTARHESRRIDDQLRGRCGRQGDPGSTRFFLALDDQLFTTFAGERMKNIMRTFRVEEDMNLENPIIQKALDNAQVKVEEYYRDIRDQLFKYDQVMSVQREAIYAERRRILFGSDENVNKILHRYCRETAEEIFNAFVGGSKTDLPGLAAKLQQFFKGIQGVQGDDLGARRGELSGYIIRCVERAVKRKGDEMEGTKEGLSFSAFRYLGLVQIDSAWQSHIRSMDYVKDFIGLKAYGQEDPLQAYQSEGYELFRETLGNVRRNTVFSFFQYSPSRTTASVTSGETKDKKTKAQTAKAKER